MRLAKILMIVALVYVGIVATFESLLGYFQPADAQTMVITTYDSEGQGADRVVARLESNGALYVGGESLAACLVQRRTGKRRGRYYL
jgi:hypothetical protein